MTRCVVYCSELSPHFFNMIDRRRKEEKCELDNAPLKICTRELVFEHDVPWNQLLYLALWHAGAEECHTILESVLHTHSAML